MMTTKIICRYSLITILLVVSIFISLCVGYIMVHPIDVIKGIFTQDDFILNKYCIPRTLLGIIIGSSLATSSAIVQAVIRNPLTSPDVVGISKGASLAAVIITMTFPTAPLLVLPIGPSLGALTVSLFLSFSISKYGARGSKSVLIGLVIGAICAAIVQFSLIRNPLETNKALVWLTGSPYEHDMSNIYTTLFWFLITISVIILLSYQSDVLNLGDAAATAFGLKAKTIKMLLLILAVILAGSVISVVSGISSLGLIAPHITRQLIGNKTLHVITMSGSTGVTLLIFGDGLACGIHPPLDIPAGIIIAIIGAPYFSISLRRMK